MRAASAREIFTAPKGFVMLAPHNDGKYLTETFDEALFDGSMAQVPIMIGYNKDDMGMLAGASVDNFCAARDSLGFPVYEYEFLRELPQLMASIRSRESELQTDRFVICGK